MKKKSGFRGFIPLIWNKKCIKIMRLTILFLFVGLMQVSASLYSQNTKFNLNFHNTRILEVLEAIENQSEFRFAYSPKYIDMGRKVDVDIKGKSIEQTLSVLLNGTEVNYSINDRHILLFLANEQANPAQQKGAVSGKVTDSSGATLPGVSVVIKGTTSGVITDMDGKFALSNVPENAIIQFSFVGMKTQEVAVGSKSIINVTLAEEAIGIEEVVAVGYGTQKKASLTGAISSVKADKIVTTKNESVSNMLSGKMAGVRIVQKTSEPGDYNSAIQIRGFGAPLIIIDGVPRENMNRLDPNEIESVSVLKDASAAIYGVRSSNGVVLITTKKGEKGKMKLDYNGYYGVQTPIRMPKGLDPVQFMEIINENNIMRGSVAPGTLVYSQAEIDAYKNGEKKGTDWWNESIDSYAPQYQHSLSASGSSELIDYFVNLGNFNQQGIYKSGDLNYERYNLRSNVSSKITKSLKIELLLNFTLDEKNEPFGSNSEFGFQRMLFNAKPISPIYANNNPNYYANFRQGYNPVAMTYSDFSGYNRTRQEIIQATGNMHWDIPWVKGLQAKGSYTYDNTSWDNKYLQRPYSLYDYNATTDKYIEAYFGNTSVPGSNMLSRGTSTKSSTLMNLSLNYNRKIANHNLSALLLYEESHTMMDNFSALRYITLTSMEELFAGIEKNMQANMNSSEFYEIANKALVGKLTYDFGSKYYGEFAFRYDGSSKFAQGEQWGFFPSISAGWRIAEESFFKNSSSLTFIQNLKLRGSYGITGDDRTATFQYVPGYTYPITNFFFPVRIFGSSKAAGVKLRDTPNPNLTWMTSNIIDIGLDADMWNGLLGFELDFYNRKRDGLTATRAVSLPDWLGEGLALENLNSDETSGFDLMMKHRNSINTGWGKIKYGISPNIGVTRTYRRYVVRKPSTDQWDDWRNNPNNRPNDIWWGYSTVGRFNNMDDIFSHAILDSRGNSQMKPGDYKLEDWNEDGVIDGWDIHPISAGLDQNTPRVFYGALIDLQFKGFDINAVFQGGAMSTVKTSDQLRTPFGFDEGGANIFYDRWHMKDPLADPKDPRTEWIPGFFPTISQNSTAMGINFGVNSYTVQDADYLRLKSLELGYTIPKAITDKIRIQNIRLYCSAYNLFTITSLQYLDPEHPSESSDLLYPLMRTINFGGQITF
jgi:TonB-linked SusC/RagA family outer membrane protein